ncbi:putative WRKY transcription factor 75 [Morus notabilis]|uniref:Putative WRKY transcription factor 75 n=2 Tax=Morus notabilis TaxID=981085 RepID=W9SYW2_9ROSA|nr:putative WRKY transcription factor 75 [Morus notabilis]
MASSQALISSFDHGYQDQPNGLFGLRTDDHHHLHHHQNHVMIRSNELDRDHHMINSTDQNGINNDGDHEGKSSSAGKIKKGDKKMRKPKYAFQTRSQVDILDDGYRWRKYGQKAVKNNKFPRSYYRCTHQGCNVKKQVQRLTKDEGVVVTTYEGMHTHPIEKHTDNFEHILNQMQIYTPF